MTLYSIIRVTSNVTLLHRKLGGISLKVTKEKKGITLIALVITIILLLILARISIQAITNQGLFSQANNAKKATEIANIKDQINLDIYEKQLEPPLGSITQAQLEEILQKYGTIIYEEDGTTIKSIKTEKGYEILLSDIYSGGTNKEEKTLLADGSWNSSKKVNSPKLMQGMTGIYWDKDGKEVTVTADNQDNWYNYSEQKWANAKTEDGSYWVWIPRYAYKITSNLNNGGTGVSGTILVDFLQGKTNKNASGTEISKTYPTVVNNAMTAFVVHPSFTNGTENNFMNGEWDEEIPGFWVAKYAAGFQECTQTVASDGTITEPTINLANVKYSDSKYTSYNENFTINALGQTLTSAGYATQKLSYPIFKPLTYAYNVISVGDSYTISKEIASASNFYGLSSNQTDSHQMKNSEWGAVAYLTQSSCGRNGKEVTINSKNLNNSTKQIYAVTGYAENTANGVSASSTNNKTGVFDLNGCVWERTSLYIPNENINLSTYGKSFASLVANANGYKTLSTKWVTVYPYNSTSDENVNNYNIYKDLKSATYGFGDAILETSSAGTYFSAWNGNYSPFVGSDSPFLAHGGAYGYSAGTGLFAFHADVGGSYDGNGFRAVLIGNN